MHRWLAFGGVIAALAVGPTPALADGPLGTWTGTAPLFLSGPPGGPCTGSVGGLLSNADGTGTLTFNASVSLAPPDASGSSAISSFALTYSGSSQSTGSFSGTGSLGANANPSSAFGSCVPPSVNVNGSGVYNAQLNGLPQTGTFSFSATPTGAITLTFVPETPQGPPTVSPLITPPLPFDGRRGWYTSDVTVSWIVSGATSTRGCDTQVVYFDTVGATFSCQASNDAGTTVKSVTIKRDATRPTIGGFIDPSQPDGNNGWYVTAPTITWLCADATSGLDPELGCQNELPRPYVKSGSSPVSVTFVSCGTPPCPPEGQAVDQAGNFKVAFLAPIEVDLIDPVITCPSPAPVFAWDPSGLTPLIGAAASDAESGLAPAPLGFRDGGAVLGTVGDFVATATAQDNAGRRAAKDCAYEVRYALQSFQIVGPPVHEAGSAIVMRLSISGGDPGTNIFAPGYPQTIQVDCNTGVRIGAPQSANLIGGTHDLGGGNFQFELKTDSKTAGCFSPVLGKTIDVNPVSGLVFILVNGNKAPRGG